MYGECLIVNEKNEPLEVTGVVESHTGKARLHRAFSIFLFDSSGKLLVQQRSKDKKTYPLAYTNTVCSHQRNDKESDEWFCQIRLMEELGIKVPIDRFKYVLTIRYEATANADFSESEIDRIFMVSLDEDWTQVLENANPNPDEVESAVFMDDLQINDMLTDNRKLVSPWFRSIWGLLKSRKTVNNESIHKTMINISSIKTLESEEIIDLGKVDMPDTMVHSDNIILSPFSYISSMKGKDMRGKIIRCFGNILGSSSEDVEFISGVVDRIHQASLVLDDIEDKSCLRRGARTAHIVYGIPLSINAGVFALTTTIEDSVKKNPEYGVHVINAVNELHRGQGAEIYWTEYRCPPTIKQLIEVMKKKTGALFTLGLEMLLIKCLGKDLTLKAMLLEWIQLFGVYFQIRDDYINLTDPDYWKLKGFCDDFDEKKYSYIVALFLAMGIENQVLSDFEALFYKDNKTKQDKETLLEILSEHDVFSHAVTEMEVISKKLYRVLEKLDNHLKGCSLGSSSQESVFQESGSQGIKGLVEITDFLTRTSK